MLIKNVTIDPTFSESLQGEVHFHLFEKDILVYGFTNESLDYANSCAHVLVKLEESLIIQLCQASIRYYNAYLEATGERKQPFIYEKQVLKLIEPLALIIEDGQVEPAIHLEFNCNWNDEHGMEWSIRNDSITYVGPVCGVGPFDEIEEDGNYANW